MSCFLQRILISLTALLLYIPVNAANLPADTVTERYLRGLDITLQKRISDNATTSEKDFLVTYNNTDFFVSDFRNNGEYFWFQKGSEQEKLVRKVVNDAQLLTGGGQLYIVLASIYNSDNPAKISDPDWSSIKEKGKYDVKKYLEDRSLAKNIIPKIQTRIKLPQGVTAIYVISFFSVENGKYTVTHRCMYTGAASLVNNGFKATTSDHVFNHNTEADDVNEKRLNFLLQTVNQAATAIGQFNEELKRVNGLFAQLPKDCLGMQFYNAYKDYCKNELTLKKLTLLINEMGYDVYTPYLTGKKRADSFDASVFEQFYENLNNFNEKYKKFSDELKRTYSISKIIKILNEATHAQMSALSYPQRILAIRLLNILPELEDNSLWQLTDYISPGYMIRQEFKGSEDAIVALITTTPATQQRDLLKALEDEQFKLLNDIFYKVDDEPVGNANYSTLMQYLASFVVSNATNDKFEAIYTKNRIYTWEDGGILKNMLDNSVQEIQTFTTTWNGDVNNITVCRFYAYVPEYDGKGRVSLALYPAGNVKWVDEDGKTTKDVTRVNTSGNPLGKDKLTPFELIAIVPTGAINFHTGFSVEPDEVTLVPAFFLEWYLKKERNQHFKDGINLSLAAFTTFTGVGAIIRSAGWTAKILAAAETAFALTGIAGEYDKFNNFMKNNLGNHGYAIFKGLEFGVNIFSAGKGLAAIGKGAYNNIKSLSTAFADAMKKQPGFLEKLRLAYPKRFKKICGLMGQEQLAVDLNSIVDGKNGLANKLGKFSENDMMFDVPEGVANEINEAWFAKREGTWSDPDLGFRNPPGGNGALQVVQKTTTARRASVSQALLAETTSRLQLLKAEERVATYVTAANTTQQTEGVLKLWRNAQGTATLVILAVEDQNYVLHAEGAAKPLVATATSTQPDIIGLPTEPEDFNNRCTLCPDQPLICTLWERSTYERKGEALGKLCDQLPTGQLAAVCVKLMTFPNLELDIFLTDLVKNIPPGIKNCNINSYLAQNVRLLTPGLINAWQVFEDADPKKRHCLRVSPPHLQKLERAMENLTLSNAPYNMITENYSKIAGACYFQNAQSSAVDDEIFVNLNEFANRHYDVRVFSGLKSNLQNPNPYYYSVVGANWVLKYMQTHRAEFQDATEIRFESTTVLDESGKRISDLTLLKNGTKIFYEFKSYKTSSLSNSKFAEQLIKDMKRPEVVSCEQMKWIFDGDKTDKAAVFARIKTELKGKVTELNNSKILPLLRDLAKYAKYTKKINTVQDITDFLNDKDSDWFDLIFHVEKIE